MEKHRASERAIVAALAEIDSQALDTNAATTTGNNMQKPSARGPSPGRKAVHALGARLNRKPKQPPPLPSKKKISNADRAVNH
jgi:hypothetical protein